MKMRMIWAGKKKDAETRAAVGNKIVLRITAGMAAVLTAVGISGCGTEGLSGQAAGGTLQGQPLSASTEDLTGQYRSVSAEDSADRHGNEDQSDSTLSTAVPVTDTFRQSYTDFSLRLLKESWAKEKQPNMMVSPLSVMAALEMARSGADGETESQMARTLYGEALPEELGRELMAYLKALPNEEKARFHFANSIWFHTADAGFHVNEDFLKNSAKDYDAKIYGAPFDESTLQDINHWVAQETEGMIPDILGQIPEDAVMYLVNAVAFDAKWQETYEEHQIRTADFRLENGSTEAVDMMYSEESVYLEDDSATGFMKPYAGNYAFAALLPREDIGIDEYLEGLSGEAFVRLMDTARNTAVEAGMPRFSSETDLSLKDALTAMGMPAAFDSGQADFGGIGYSEDGPIYISRVLHKTFIQVDAMGTKAGAATAVEMKDESAAEIESEPEIVILDRPFVYAIVDMETKLPVFLGVMEAPEKQ